MLFLSAKTGKSGSKGIGWRSSSAIYPGKTSKTPPINPTCVVITNKDLHSGWMFTELVQTNRLTQAPSWVPNTSKLQEAKNSFADREGNSPVCKLLVPTAGQETTLLASAGE